MEDWQLQWLSIWVYGSKEKSRRLQHMGFQFSTLEPCHVWATYLPNRTYIYICNIASGFVVTERQSAKLLNCNESNEYLLITGVSIQIVSLFPHIDSKFPIVAANPNPNSSMVNLGAELV